MSLTWMTEEKSWDELIQITDNYVVHARGFTIGDDLYLDEYSLRSEHHRWWNDIVRHYYNLPEYGRRQNWNVYAGKNIEQTWVYWSINATGMFLLQNPKKEYLDEETFNLAMETLDALDTPEDAVVKFEPSRSDDDSASSHAQAILKKVDNPQHNKHKYEYGEIDGIETLK